MCSKYADFNDVRIIAVRNPFYIRNVRRLVDSFVEIDASVDLIERARGHMEYWQLHEISERISALLPVVDTLPLPKNMHRAAKDTGDFFYLLQNLVSSALTDAYKADEALDFTADLKSSPATRLTDAKDTSANRLAPTVFEARKYKDQEAEESDQELFIVLNSCDLHEVLIYRAKARETLRAPANTYGLSVEQAFSPL